MRSIIDLINKLSTKEKKKKKTKFDICRFTISFCQFLEKSDKRDESESQRRSFRF